MEDFKNYINGNSNGDMKENNNSNDSVNNNNGNKPWAFKP